ncbi:MFS superfamily sulfate permease-like transporter [Novosphingobium chloroacetimidivorans]|uniref:MFS superfamily sulfate permease-like transporter n=1 Tax=Novosphingobium chloroacetimidivorans TaxID=1428314 RepID=A0A7W7K5S6_9SPHN|nr:SulP family inorganic anion transporter [Novosphingobium chloroacetimidivorans]MBB4856769.1 MFS superfamily sulfate permease-like transporter [Novosphingobium chloroacetimidivorans]
MTPAHTSGTAEERTGPFAHLTRDFTASIVVFLVAMPLCMGIAIASGVPPERGLVTGIIGGIVVGLLAGSPLQVSGPAAGLAVIVFEFVREHGIEALGPVLLLAGVLQLVAGWLKMGGLFRAISPAVVHGMLAGIGALIVIGQFHILFDKKPMSSGLQNMAAMPERVLGLNFADVAATELALGLGVLTIVVMLGWEKLRPKSLSLVPGALLGVLAATAVAWSMGLGVARIEVPASLAAAFALPTSSAWLAPLANPALLVAAVAIAFIASAETLLSAAAVDRMHDGVRTNYNKELRAQGIGNFLCGAFGALPMTGVIVRSSANVQAGARTRLSAVLHGVWILGFVALLPWLLREVPMAALGGVLVVTGWRLVSLKHVQHLFKAHGPLPAVIWTVTFVLVVTTDLLTGVLVGLALSLVEVLPHIRDIRLKVHEHEDNGAYRVELAGAATFLGLTRLNAVLENQPADRSVHLDLDRVKAMDHTTAETLTEWINRRRHIGHNDRITGPADVLRPLPVAS